MNSDRNLMQFNFNHLLSLSVDRPLLRLSLLWCFCFAAAFWTVPTPAHGQAQHLDELIFQLQRQEGFAPAPRNFGDTPSPTEMMARLKFHKQQETPLFDLLREGGVDIFAKLSDEEKKLAGRFVEDMILKEGMNSDKVSSLMEHMNINDAARQALQEGIERAGGGESSISPKDRKELAKKIRKQFLQQAEKLRSANNPNGQPPNQRSASANPSIPNTGRDRSNSETGTTANQVNKYTKLIEKLLNEQRGTGQKQQRTSSADSDERIKSLQRRLAELRQASPEARQGETANQSTRSSDGRTNELAGPGSKPNPNFGDAGFDPDSSNNGPSTDNSNSPNKPRVNNPLMEEAFRQLESNLSEPQREVITEFKDKIQNGDVNGQEVKNLFDDLQSAKTTREFAKRLDQVGKELNLPVDSRQKVQDAYGQLSSKERRSMQQALRGLDQEALSRLLANNSGTEPSRRSSGTSSPTGSRDSNAGQPTQSQLQDLGREFLQDALKTYNDPDSGYELSNAFKRLKDQAEGLHSDREMANLGNLSKKLFEDSSIFDSNSASETRKERGLKPGQRLDQLLASAANKALADKTNDSQGEEDSVFADVLNQALSVALDQAVTAADKDLENRNRDVAQGWNQWPPNKPTQLDPWAPDNFPDINGSQPYDSTSNPTTPTNNANSGSANTVQDSAASFAETMSQLKINWPSILIGVGLIALLTGCLFWLSRTMQPASQAELKQRELQMKLKNRSANPKDLVEAVDLFLLSRFGAASSWWNSKHAAKQISEAQPDRRDKVSSLFQVYRWSRYQPEGSTDVSPEQTEIVKSTLQELSQVPIESFDKTKSSPQHKAKPAAKEAEGKS